MNIVTKIHGLHGKLSRANSLLLESLLVQPNKELWQSAKNMVVSDQPLITLNAAVNSVTKGQVVIGELPDTFTLYRALRYSVGKREKYFNQMEVCDTES